jgi:hypothetical protein
MNPLLTPSAQFECCGYFNSTSPAFVTTPEFCPSPAAAALMRGCAGPLSSFINELLDNIFTAVFGVVGESWRAAPWVSLGVVQSLTLFPGIDVVLIVSIVCLLKNRKERERYRHIDEKTGYRTF